MNQGEKDTLERAKHYCAYQERCQKDVRDRLRIWGISSTDAESTIADLITSGFVDEERFARIYAGGKFRQKKWGRIKITMELKKRHLTDYCINAGLSEIEEEDYVRVLESIIETRRESNTSKDKFVKNKQIATYCIRKGYEAELVWSLLT